jgi:hypothetical protein
MAISIDSSGWFLKSAAVEKAIKEASKEAVDFAIDEIKTGVTQNLGGVEHPPGTPSPYPGQLPVTMISGNLHQAVDFKRIDDTRGIVYIDKNKAPYAVHVHFGTHKMRPRRFMSDTMAERRQAIINRQRYLIKLKVRRAGGNPSEILGL